MASKATKKQKICVASLCHKMSYDSWTVVIRYLNDSKDLFSVFLVIKGLFQYVMKNHSCVENVEFGKPPGYSLRHHVPWVVRSAEHYCSISRPRLYVRILHCQFFEIFWEFPTALEGRFPNLIKLVCHLFGNNFSQIPLNSKTIESLVLRMGCFENCVANLPSLKHFHAHGFGGKAGLSTVRIKKDADYPRLESMYLIGVNLVHPPKISMKRTLKHLHLEESLFALTRFRLDHSFVELRSVSIATCSNLSKISGCPKLERIELKTRKESYFGLKEISNLSSLQEIEILQDPDIFWDAIEHDPIKIENIPNIRSLKISGEDFPITLTNIGMNGALEEFRVISKNVSMKNVLICCGKIRVVEIRNDVFFGEIDLLDKSQVEKLEKIGLKLIQVEF